MLKFDVITLFPDVFKPHFELLPFKRAIQKNLIDIKLWNLRDYAIDKRGTVDDKPYGGGIGMILRIEPLSKALEKIGTNEKNSNRKIIFLTPTGKPFTQKLAQEYAKLNDIVLICGRYEGVDARIEELITDKISIGNYVLSGGELPALVLMEGITRIIPGSIEKDEALKTESHTDGYLEYPQYTRPETYKGMSVPEVLLSGNHKEIEKWKKKNLKNTSTRYEKQLN